MIEDKRITELTEINAIFGNEELPIVQNNITKKITPFTLKEYFGTGAQVVVIPQENETDVAISSSWAFGHTVDATAHGSGTASFGQVLTADGLGNSVWGLPQTSVTVSNSAPNAPSPGDLWYDSINGQLLIYYQDADSSQWITTSTAYTVSYLNGLLDVNITNGLQSGQILTWDGVNSQWIPNNLPAAGISGSVGTTNNALLRADTTTGEIKSSNVVIDDDNVVTGLILKDYKESNQNVTTTENITLSLNNGNVIRITLGGNHQITLPTITENISQSFTLILECNTYTPSWNSTPTIKWLTGNGLMPEVVKTANLVNVLSFIWDSTDSRWLGFFAGKET